MTKSKPPLGAGEGNRTPDLLITNQLLYRLSHASILSFVKNRTPDLLLNRAAVLAANVLASMPSPAIAETRASLASITNQLLFRASSTALADFGYKQHTVLFA